MGAHVVVYEHKAHLARDRSFQRFYQQSNKNIASLAGNEAGETMFWDMREEIFMFVHENA